MYINKKIVKFIVMTNLLKTEVVSTFRWLFSNNHRRYADYCSCNKQQKQQQQQKLYVFLFLTDSWIMKGLISAQIVQDRNYAASDKSKDKGEQ